MIFFFNLGASLHCLPSFWHCLQKISKFIVETNVRKVYITLKSQTGGGGGLVRWREGAG